MLAIAETSHPGGLAGEGRALFDALIRAAGADPREVMHLGVTSATKIKDAMAEYPTVAAALAELRPDKVIALGGTAATVVKQARKRVAITKERGLAEWVEYEGGRAMLVCTVDPAMVLRRAGSVKLDVRGNASTSQGGTREWVRDLTRDVAKWVRQDAPQEVPRPWYLRPESPAALARWLDALDEYQAVSVDLETEPGETALLALRAAPSAAAWREEWPAAGLKPLEDRVMSLGLGTASGPCVIVRRPLLTDPEALALLWDFLWERPGRLDPPRVAVFHNGKFDLQFLDRLFGRPAPLGAAVADTMLLSWLLDERPVRSQYRTHGLKDISRTRYDVPDYSFDWPDFWRLSDAERPWATLDRYHAMDLRQTARLYWDLLAEAADEPGVLAAHGRLLVPATLALARAELAGIRVDRRYLRAYRARLDRRLDLRQRGLRAALGDPDFNPGSSQEADSLVFDDAPKGWAMQPMMYSGFKTTLGQRGEAFFKRNSRKEHFEMIAGSGQADRRQAKILRAITAWRHDSKARETYAEGLLRSSVADGRAHSSFNLGGAVTGRLSSSDPNLQNIPKRGPTADAIRRAFVAPPGWLLIEGDYSQLELRVAALLSGDRRFVEVYREGRDIHREVAAVMFHKSAGELSDLERYLAKAVDFGAVYGRSGKAISLGAEMDFYEKKLGGTRWTAEEAQAFVDRFLGGFPDLRRWMAETAAAALRDRRLETPFGRVRRFPLVLRDDVAAVRRQAYNTPIQSVASDICLSAFIRLSTALDPAEARPLVTIHDSVLLEVRRSALTHVSAQVKALMEDVPEEVVALNRGLGIPFAVNIKAGPTWRDEDMHEVET